MMSTYSEDEQLKQDQVFLFYFFIILYWSQLYHQIISVTNGSGMGNMQPVGHIHVCCFWPSFSALT